MYKNSLSIAGRVALYLKKELQFSQLETLTSI